MARQLRIEYPDAIYHVMARGNRREDIVLDDVDREMFVRTMGETCEKTGWRWAIARQTSQRQDWIAKQLGLRTGGNVSQQIRRAASGLSEGPYSDHRFKKWSRLVKN